MHLDAVLENEMMSALADCLVVKLVSQLAGLLEARVYAAEQALCTSDNTHN
jgi:hypothetical protein